MFFLRPPDEPWTPGTGRGEQLAQGDLWVANADGSGERQISFGKTNVSYAGFLMTEEGPTVYYISNDETASHLWRRVLETGVETETLSFRPPGPPRYDASAAVSPDGRHVAFVDGGDIALADLATAERHTLFESNAPGCEETDMLSCFSYNRPHWSPDGSLLAAGRSGWEWWGQFIVDPFTPFAQPPAREPFKDVPYVAAELDWRTSDEACAVIAGGLSGLYLIHGPDWVLDYPQAEDIAGYCPLAYKAECRGTIHQCSWLDDRRIAYWMTAEDPDEWSRIEVIDVDTREIATLAEFASDPRLGSMMDIFSLRDEGLLVYNRYHAVLHQEPPYDEVFTTPGLIRVADGTQQSILRERDHVVAVVSGMTMK